MTTSTTRETPVLIVGGGPVGLALAADLGWRGTECVLIEQTDGTINTPKMNEVNIRTMEHSLGSRWTPIAQRWLGAVLLHSEKGFKKVKGYAEIVAVVAAIEAEQAEAKKLKSAA